jgi:hypothetical protein
MQTTQWVASRSLCVLLTDTLTAKVAGFRLRLGGDAGEGVDPEYLRTYQLTVKSDVYSFGVLLVVFVAGHPPVEHSCGATGRSGVERSRCRALSMACREAGSRRGPTSSREERREDGAP